MDAIEVVEAKLDSHRFAEQMGSIKEAGLGIRGVQPTVRTFFDSRMTPDPTPELNERVACLRGSIERLGRHAPVALFITNTGVRPNGDMAEAMRVVAAKLGELARVAADDGIPARARTAQPHLHECRERDLDHRPGAWCYRSPKRDEVGLCLDCGNIWQSADVEAALRGDALQPERWWWTWDRHRPGRIELHASATVPRRIPKDGEEYGRSESGGPCRARNRR